MPDRIADSAAGISAGRVRAAYRARACAAAIATGTQVFLTGTALVMDNCLNAAYLAMFASLPPLVLLVWRAHRRLARGAQNAGPASRLLPALLAVTLLFCCLMDSVGAAALAEQSLLPDARLIVIPMLTLAGVVFCAASGETGPVRALFTMRLLLPAQLILLTLAAMSFDTPSGLFPLLGAGKTALMHGMFCALGACAPAAILLLPPSELAGRYPPPYALPRLSFFLWRVLLGAFVGLLLLMALSLCNTYETLDAHRLWGERLLIMCVNRPRSGLSHTLLILGQLTAMVLSASLMLRAAVQSLRAALPDAAPTPLCWVLCLLPYVAAGFSILQSGPDWMLRASPALIGPVLLLLLWR